jgi:hypothetical protein
MTDSIKPGLSLPTATADVSPVAPLVLAAAVGAAAKTAQIPNLPRGVVDQANLPCCVSCALAAAMEAIHPSWPALAPLFHYYVTRYENAGADVDGSLILESGLATLNQQGISSHDLHALPYTVAGAATKPLAEAYADALTRLLGRIGRRARALQVSGPSAAAWIREQLDQDRPVVMAFQLPAGYPSAFLNSDKEWRDTGPMASDGHCVLVFGYSDSRRAFHLQDSRGPNQFENGRWWIAYSVVDSSVLQNAYSLIP